MWSEYKTYISLQFIKFCKGYLMADKRSLSIYKWVGQVLPELKTYSRSKGCILLHAENGQVLFSPTYIQMEWGVSIQNSTCSSSYVANGTCRRESAFVKTDLHIHFFFFYHPQFLISRINLSCLTWIKPYFQPFEPQSYKKTHPYTVVFFYQRTALINFSGHFQWSGGNFALSTKSEYPHQRTVNLTVRFLISK